MRTIKGIWYFYQKLILPSLAVSVVISVFSPAYVPLIFRIGFSYSILSPLVHLYTYEINTPGEYYFYYNLGLSKLALWLNTMAVSTLLLLSFLLV